MDNREVDLQKIVDSDQSSIVELVGAKTALNQALKRIGNPVHPFDCPHFEEDCRRQTISI